MRRGLFARREGGLQVPVRRDVAAERRESTTVGEGGGGVGSGERGDGAGGCRECDGGDVAGGGPGGTGGPSAAAPFLLEQTSFSALEVGGGGGTRALADRAADSADGGSTSAVEQQGFVVEDTNGVDRTADAVVVDAAETFPENPPEMMSLVEMELQAAIEREEARLGNEEDLDEEEGEVELDADEDPLRVAGGPTATSFLATSTRATCNDISLFDVKPDESSIPLQIPKRVDGAKEIVVNLALNPTSFPGRFIKLPVEFQGAQLIPLTDAAVASGKIEFEADADGWINVVFDPKTFKAGSMLPADGSGRQFQFREDLNITFDKTGTGTDGDPWLVYRKSFDQNKKVTITFPDVAVKVGFVVQSKCEADKAAKLVADAKLAAEDLARGGPAPTALQLKAKAIEKTCQGAPGRSKMCCVRKAPSAGLDHAGVWGLEAVFWGAGSWCWVWRRVGR